MNEARHEVTIDGLKVVYYRFGKGEPLLFLHGGRLRALTFKHSLEELAKQYTIFAPDIPGYGLSDTPQEVWSYSEYAKFFDSFLENLGIRDVTLVGYSMGGGIAFNLAAASNSVHRLVLVDASGLHGTNRKPVRRDMQRLMFYVARPQYYATLVTLIREAVGFIWKHRSDSARMQRIRRTCFDTSYESALRQVSIPTLLLWADNDNVIPLSIAEKFQNSIPQSQLKTVQGTHDWPLYKPLLFSQSVL